MKHAKKESAATDFATDSISRIVFKNSLPALIAMVMVMVYNLADTFFLGLTHNDLQVTAVSYAVPIFMIFMSLGTLFGVGGTSVISRALGSGDLERARKASSFCMWACVAIGIVSMALLWIFIDSVISALGANAESYSLTYQYLAITISCGVFSMISSCFSNILRAEGEPMKAMAGTIAGNLINLVLDPVMILGFGWGVTGAAVATVIGNVVSALYYLLWFWRGKSSLSISIRCFCMKEGIFTGIVSIGISASLANILFSISSMVVNGQLSGYANGDLLVAGYGVTSKIIMIVTLIGIGIASGVQPFFGYCFGAKQKERLKAGLRFSVIFALVLCFVIAGLCFLFAGPVVKIFLTEANGYKSGTHFVKILMTTAWLIGPFAVLQICLQAAGAAVPALLATLFRQCIIFIPMAFILQSAIGIDGLLWAQPIADVLSVIIILLMVINRIKKSPA